MAASERTKAMILAEDPIQHPSVGNKFLTKSIHTRSAITLPVDDDDDDDDDDSGSLAHVPVTTASDPVLGDDSASSD